MTGDVTSRQIVPKSPACPEGLFLMDGIEGLRSLPKHSVDMLLTDPPYGTTRNFWDVPLPLPELWEAVKWAAVSYTHLDVYKRQVLYHLGHYPNL